MSTKIEWVHEGFEQILCAPGTMSQVQAVTEQIKNRANAANHRGGSGFESGTRVAKAFGSRRASGFVYTTDRNSRIAEAEDKALSKAVG
jgi:hypothetical protein